MNLKSVILWCSLLILLVGGVVYCLYLKQAKNESRQDEIEYIKIWEETNKLYNAGNITAALQYSDSAYGSRRYISFYGLYEKYSNIGLYYYKKNAFDTSLIYADSALLVLDSKQNDKKYQPDYLHALISKADVLFNLRDYNQANVYYFKAKLYAQSTTSTCFLNEFSYSMGMALFRQSKFQEAAREFEECVEEGMTCKLNRPLFRLQETISNIALCFNELNIFDSSIYYNDSALRFIERHKEEFGPPVFAEKAKGVVYGNLSTIYFKLNQWDTAEKYMKKSIAINGRPNCETSDAQKIKMSLANLYFKENKLDMTYRTLEEIKNSLDTIPDEQVTVDWRKLMYLYYDEKNEPLKAYGYYRSYVTYRDSLLAKNKEQSNTDVLREVKEKEQVYQIRLLKKDQESAHFYLLVTIAFAVFAVIIVTLVYVNYRRSTTQNKIIARREVELAKSNREKDRILNVVAHDLRSPIGGVAYLAELMLEEADANSSTMEYLMMIRNSSSQSLYLINELVGSISDEVVANRQKTDMVNLLKGAVQQLLYKAKEKKQVLEFNTSHETLELLVDKEKIVRVVNNLVSNAIKFTDEGGLIVVSLKREKQLVVVSVKDNGIGIPARYLSQLFEMFTPSKRAGTAGEKSFGIGLSICKNIVQAHGGRIRVESEEGRGSTFFVEFPVKFG